MASLESLERTLSRWQRHDLHVLVEHKPPSELVSPVDLVRTDGLGREYIACPAGQAPHSELQLTDEEKAALIRPSPSLPKGHMTPVGFGFSPEHVVRGDYPNGD